MLVVSFVYADWYMTLVGYTVSLCVCAICGTLCQLVRQFVFCKYRLVGKLSCRQTLRRFVQSFRTFTKMLVYFCSGIVLGTNLDMCVLTKW